VPRDPNRRFWIEAGLAAVTAWLLVLTLITREWIEAITGWDPDRGSGSLEWGLIVALLVASLVFSGLARAEWKRRLLVASWSGRQWRG
jgi:hypothetical protein